jgi:hypothetical protein
VVQGASPRAGAAFYWARVGGEVALPWPVVECSFNAAGYRGDEMGVT